MINNVIFKSYNFIKKLLLYQAAREPSPFVLDETPEEKQADLNQLSGSLTSSLRNFETLLRYAKRLNTVITKVNTVLREEQLPGKIEVLKAECQVLEKQKAELEPILLAYQSGQPIIGERSISSSLEENRKVLETLYHYPLNKDLIIREIDIVEDSPVSAVIVFIDGMVDTKILNLSVLQPLMMIAPSQYRSNNDDLLTRIVKGYLPANQVQMANNFVQLQEGINSGDTAIIIDGISQAVLVNTKGWEHRGIEKPSTEPAIRGGQAGFTENIRANTALVRTILRSSDLVTEMMKVGSHSRTNVAMLYLKTVANPQLVAEVRRRIQEVDTDNLDSSGVLIQFIEDSPNIPFPQSLSTERPDRVGPHLSEGRIAIIVDGNPYVHIVPVSFFTFFHASEDFSVQIIVANFMRILRFFGTLIATVLPSLYIGISYFHVEALPTELLLAIAGSREDVPFPAWFEVLVMELSFELIREAGVRVPGVLGTTIGIVGAIILGQAAVSAHIVSPVVVVIIAITGLASYTIPEYRMSACIRLVRFLFLLFSAFLGLVGLATAILWLTVILCSMKSFGMPYLVPVAPKTMAGFDVVLRGPVYRQENRPDALNTKDKNRQPSISRSWTTKKPIKKGRDKG